MHFTLNGQERTYAVIPLTELYGPGVEAATFDPVSDEYIQLCTDIEMAIVKRHIAFDDLSNAQVLLALDRLAITRKQRWIWKMWDQISNERCACA